MKKEVINVEDALVAVHITTAQIVGKEWVQQKGDKYNGFICIHAN